MRKNWQNLGFLSLFFSQIFKGERKNCFQAIGCIYNFILSFLLQGSHDCNHSTHQTLFFWVPSDFNSKNRLLIQPIRPSLKTLNFQISFLGVFVGKEGSTLSRHETWHSWNKIIGVRMPKTFKFLTNAFFEGKKVLKRQFFTFFRWDFWKEVWLHWKENNVSKCTNIMHLISKF